MSEWKTDRSLAPCRGCQDRHVGCHGGCERYREYREERDRRLAERRIRADIRDIRTAAVERTRRDDVMRRKRRGI